MTLKSSEASPKRIDDARGEVTASIGRLEVVDRDGDVVSRGAVGQQVTPILPAHRWDAIPLGKATVAEQGGELIAKMRFNRRTPTGADWFESVRFDLEHPPPKQQWSYSFLVEPGGARQDVVGGRGVRRIGKMRLYDVSPVILGAGINTRTLDLKRDRAVQEFKRVTARSWGRPHGEPAGFGWRITVGPPSWDATKRRAEKYAALAAEELGVAPPGIFLFRAVTPGERADFTTTARDPMGVCPTGALLRKHPGAIGLRHDVEPDRQIAITAGHETYHHAHPGADESEAERFGESFADRHVEGGGRTQEDFLRRVAVAGALAQMHGWSEREHQAVLRRL
jgi:hypothetical protein